MTEHIRCGATYEGVGIASKPGLRGLLEQDPGNVQFHPAASPHNSQLVINGINIPFDKKLTVAADEDSPCKWVATVEVRDGKAHVS